MIFELIDAIRTADVWSVISIILSSAILLLICMPVHEWAHARAAYSLGDDTARYQGRMTLRPSRHLDLIGSIMILAVGVGYARPVPVNPMNFKNRKRDMALVAAAGPLSNLVMGVIFTFILVCIQHFLAPITLGSQTAFNIYIMLQLAFGYAAVINISLAVFNLIPIPPFDGSRILGLILPDRVYWKIMQYEQIIYIVVLVLLVGGVMSGPLATLQQTVFGWIYNLVSLPFNLLS